MRKLTLCISAGIALLTGSTIAKAQDASPVNIDANTTPSNALQGKGSGGNLYNVDLYTGTMNASIPIYSYSVDGVDASIDLGYSGRGVRVDDIASSIGLGWNLYAGGSIQRTTNGIEDEVAITPSIQQTPNGPNEVPGPIGSFAYYDNTNSLLADLHPEINHDLFEANFGGRTIKFTVDFHPNPYYIEPVVKVSPKSEVSVKVLGQEDVSGQPKEFYLNTNYFPNSSNYITNAPKDYGLNKDYGYLVFEITDEKGNVFYFDRGDYEKQIYTVRPTDSSTTVTYYPVRSWKLRKITTYTGQVITFDYKEFDNVVYPLYSDETVVENNKYEGDPFNNNDLIPANATITKKTQYFSGTQYGISQITYPNGVIATFNYSPITRYDISGSAGPETASALESISISSGYANVNNSLKYRFNYAYFYSWANLFPFLFPSSKEIPFAHIPDINSNYNPGNIPADIFSTALRLKLKGIDKIGLDNAQTENLYTFGYNDAVNLPVRLSPSQDYYGFYNGKSPVTVTFTKGQFDGSSWNNTADTTIAGLSIPQHDFQPTPYNDNTLGLFTGTPFPALKAITNNYGMDKTPDINYLQANVLTSITNGSGGVTTFHYKDHNLYNSNYNYPVPATQPVNTLPRGYDEAPAGADANDGLCIDWIGSTDGFNNDNDVKTEYTFDKGQRFFRGGYFWYANVLRVNNGSYYNDLSYDYAPARTYKNHFISGSTYFNGCNHGYSFATVKTTNSNTGEFLSKTKYEFTNLVEAGSTSTADSVSAITMLGITVNNHQMMPIHMALYKMGLSRKTTSYDKNDDIVSTKDYNYVPVSIASASDTHGNSESFDIFSDANVLNFLKRNTVYQGETYDVFMIGMMHLTSVTDKQYEAGRIMTNITNYQYDRYDNVIAVGATDSKNNQYTTRYQYSTGWPDDCPNCKAYPATNPYPGKQFLMNTYSFKNNAISTNEQLLASSEHNLQIQGGFLRAVNSSILQTTSPISPNSAGQYAWPIIPISEELENTLFDGKGNVNESYSPINKTAQSFIWDSRIGKQLASATNCRFSELAATSFEGDFLPATTPDQNKGNWKFDPDHVVLGSSSDKAMTGHYYYLLDQTGGVTSGITFVPGTTYLLTFWATDLPTVLKRDGTITSQYTPTQQLQVGNWKLYSAYVGGSSNTSIFINPADGVTIKLDELRLAPINASVTTYTYEPLIGPATICDNRNNIIYYEYDNMARQTVTRDINGNILKVTQQVTQGADN